MTSIDDLIALLEAEEAGATTSAGEFTGNLHHWHMGRRDAYRHALAQARLVAQAQPS